MRKGMRIGDIVRLPKDRLIGRPRWLNNWCKVGFVKNGKHKGMLAIINPKNENDYWFLHESEVEFKNEKFEQQVLF